MPRVAMRLLCPPPDVGCMGMPVCWLCFGVVPLCSDYRASSTRTVAACCDELVPIELAPVGVQRRHRRRRRVQRAAVARVDRARGAHAARAIHVRETVGDVAPRFVREVMFVSRVIMLRGAGVVKKMTLVRRAQVPLLLRWDSKRRLRIS